MARYLTQGRLRSLKVTLLNSLAHTYPYDDERELSVLQEEGLIDDHRSITLRGAMAVLGHVASSSYQPISARKIVDETRRVLNEIEIMFGNDLPEVF